MKSRAARSGFVVQSSHAIMAIAGVALLSSGNAVLRAQTPPAMQPAVEQSATPEPEAPKIPNDQLDSLVSRSRFIPIPSWPRRWPQPLIRWRSSNFSNG